MSDVVYFGINVKRLRDQKNWSQIELAHEAGVGQQTIFRAEKGKTPRGANITKIARALGVTESYLFENPFIADENGTPKVTPNLNKEELLFIAKALSEAAKEFEQRQAPAPVVNPKDAEDAAKWREFEAKIKPGGDDLIAKLLRIGEAELDFVRDVLGLPDRPHYAEAKRREAEKNAKKTLETANSQSSRVQPPLARRRHKKKVTP